MVTSKEMHAAIIALHQNGLACKEIATKNIAPEGTIYRIIENFKESGSTAVKKSSGRPRVGHLENQLFGEEKSHLTRLALLCHRLHCGGRLLWPGGLLSPLLSCGGHLLRPGGLLSPLLNCGGPMLHSGGLPRHLLSLGGPLFPS
ncbi:hypothetical protein cypCar_00032972 [Cyprinus carpio]|nr:hypothetical protein cypCar_00032972 [Cyprinus carpio]